MSRNPAPRLVDVTLVVDTSAYASGDVVAIPLLISNLFRDKNVGGILQTLILLDEDDEGAALDFYFTSVSTTWAALNATAAPSDAALRSVQGKVSVATVDYVDLGGAKMATKHNLNIPLTPVADSTGLYVVVVNGAGTQTYTAAGDLKLRLGIVD